MKALDLRGLVPAPVTPFTRDGAVDHAAIKRLGAWLGSFKDVKGLTVLGHAGEGTFMTRRSRLRKPSVRSRRAPRPGLSIRRMAGSASATRRARRRIVTARSMRRAACR